MIADAQARYSWEDEYRDGRVESCSVAFCVTCAEAECISGDPIVTVKPISGRVPCERCMELEGITWEDIRCAI
jgi:hypothetical protein